MNAPLHHHEWPARGPSITALHGWGGTGLDFEPLAARGGARWRAVDLVGHGQSDAPDDHEAYGLNSQLDQLKAVFKPGSFLLGYSMGARLALHFALRHPATLRGLVLVSGTAGIDDESDRLSRRDWDHAQAATLETMGTSGFMTQWEQHPVIRTQARRIPATDYNDMMTRRRQARSHGLAASFRAFGAGTMPSAWDQVARLAIPTLLVVGEHDLPYRSVADRIQKLLPTADLVSIPDAGHRPHLENGTAFHEKLNHWMAGR